MQAAPVQLPPAGSHASGRSYHAARRGPCRRPLRVCAYLEPAPVATAGNKAEAPVIDAQGFLAPERDGAPPPADVAAAIKAAGAEAGCFQLVNHGISLGLIGDMQHEARRFFKLPLEQKLQVGWPGAGRHCVRSVAEPGTTATRPPPPPPNLASGLPAGEAHHAEPQRIFQRRVHQEGGKAAARQGAGMHG